MKSEHIYDALTHIDNKLIDNAGDFRYQHKHNLRKRKILFVPIALVTAAAILVGIILWPDASSSRILRAHAVTVAEYPEKSQYRDLSDDYVPILHDYAISNMRTFLSDSGTGNKTVSPLNIYMALSVLAEITDGNSRAQILNVLGCSTIEELRTTANSVWHANYRNGNQMTNLLASSLWLNKDISYNSDTLNTLADTYYASSYSGEMGNPEFNATLQNWMNEQTGGLLGGQISDISLNPLTAIALVTTVQFHAKWETGFSKQLTSPRTFHSPVGDLDCDFMYTSGKRNFYWGDKFSAVSLPFVEGGYMKILLPDEGYSPDDLLIDDEALAFLTGNPIQWENQKYLIVNMSIPKFDISSQIELSDGLKTLGITDAFNAEVSDYSPLTDHFSEPVKLSEALHGTRVTIDEDGCKAVAYTVMMPTAGFFPPQGDEIDFIVDRPFLFVISYRDHLPLFAGVVNQPSDSE